MTEATFPALYLIMDFHSATKVGKRACIMKQMYLCSPRPAYEAFAQRIH
jgi:hypothetical protein